MTAVAYVGLGALTLLAASYAYAMLAPQADEREFVVAGATLAWSLLAAGSLLLLRRILFGPPALPSATGGAAVGIGLVGATAVSFVVVGDVRQALGYYEPDAAGLAVLVAPALLATVLAVLGSEVGPSESHVAWRALAISGAIGVFVLAVAALADGRAVAGVPTALVLLASAAYSVAAGTWSTVLLRSR